MTGAIFKSLPDVREVCPTTSRRLLGEGAVLADVREPAGEARIGGRPRYPTLRVLRHVLGRQVLLPGQGQHPVA